MRASVSLIALWGLAVSIQVRYDYSRPTGVAVSFTFDDVSLKHNDEIGLFRRCTTAVAFLKTNHEAFFQYLRTEKVSNAPELRQRLADESLPWVGGNDICVDIVRLQTSRESGRVTEVLGMQMGHAALPLQSIVSRKDDQRLESIHCNSLLLPPEVGHATLRTSLIFRNGNTKPRVGEGNLTEIDKGLRYAWNRVTPTQTFSSVAVQDVSIEDRLAILRSCSTLSFIDNNPLLNVKLDRSFEVPQWTKKIRVDETYRLSNAAAKRGAQYKGSEIHQIMRRVIGTRRQNTGPLLGSTTLFNMEAYFPPGTSDHEFFDPIGNISTSQVIEKRPDEIQRIELEPRFPVLGSWKSDWTLRYHVPLEHAVVKVAEPNTFVLIISGLPAIPHFWADSSNVEVLLPPFANLKKFETPLMQADAIKISAEKRWLDLTSSRTKVTFNFGAQDLRPSPINLAQITFQTSPLLAGISHLLWIPTVSTLLIILISLPSIIPTLTSLAAQLLLSSSSKPLIAKKDRAL